MTDTDTEADKDKRRAILTDREREILLSGGEDISDNYYGVVVTRARRKIEKIARDLPALNEHPTLATELRDIVCEENTSESENKEPDSMPTMDEGLNPNSVSEDVVEDSQ
jgi:hypothetical protein